MQVRLNSTQAGKLYEFALAGTLLFLAGAIFGPHHPGFFLLSLFGLVVIFIPNLLTLFYKCRNRLRLRQIMTNLSKTGVKSDYLLVDSSSDYAVALDTSSGNVFWLDQQGSQTEKISEIVEVSLVKDRYTSLGGGERHVYTIKLFHADKKSVIEMSGLRQARRAMRNLKKYLAVSTRFSEYIQDE